MKKLKLPFIFSILATDIFSYAAPSIDTAIIHQASYFVWKKPCIIRNTPQQWNNTSDDVHQEVFRSRGFPYNPPHTCAQFYAYNGALLQEVSCPNDTDNKQMEQKLDPAAPKPQAVYYRIKYWSAIPVGRLFPWSPMMIKGCPGDFIIFYDRHANLLGSYRYDAAKKDISVLHDGSMKTYSFDTLAELRALKDFPLDLSIVIAA